MALGAGGVGVLVGLPGAFGLADEAVGDVVVAVGVLRRHGGRAYDDFGAVGLHGVALVLADLVGAHEDALVAALLGDEREADTGVAGGGLDDRSAGLEQSGGFGGVDHLDRDAVLGASTGVEVLDLGGHRRRSCGGDGRELDQRGVADELNDVFSDSHLAILALVQVTGG